MKRKKKLPISDAYIDFFSKNIDSRHVFLMGGRRSGKTFATFVFLMFLGSLWAATNANVCTIVVMCADYPQLSHTKEDFQRVTGQTPHGQGIECHCYTHGGRVMWRFLSFDDNTKAQGTSCDYAFLNEAVRIPESVAKTFMPSVRKQLYYNYNPTSHWWGEGYVESDEHNLMRTTWRDNEQNLTSEQIAEFHNMKHRAMLVHASLFDVYAYKVYYLGEYAQMVGSVFHDVETCEEEEYNNIQSREMLAIDFGFSTDGDPTTLVGVKVFAHKIYVHQYIYERGLTSDVVLGRRLLECGFNYRTEIIADYGGMGRGRINTLVTGDNGTWKRDPQFADIAKGFNVMPCLKGGVMDGLSQMCAMDAVVITKSSTETRREFEGYELDANGKPKGDDHSIDAARYAFTYIKALY